jgi:hypothetical protein
VTDKKQRAPEDKIRCFSLRVNPSYTQDYIAQKPGKKTRDNQRGIIAGGIAAFFARVKSQDNKTKARRRLDGENGFRVNFIIQNRINNNQQANQR